MSLARINHGLKTKLGTRVIIRVNGTQMTLDAVSCLPSPISPFLFNPLPLKHHYQQGGGECKVENQVGWRLTAG